MEYISIYRAVKSSWGHRVNLECTLTFLSEVPYGFFYGIVTFAQKYHKQWIKTLLPKSPPHPELNIYSMIEIMEMQLYLKRSKETNNYSSNFLL